MKGRCSELRHTRALLLAAAATLVLPTSSKAGISNRQLVELTDIDGLSLSPDGRFAVFRTEKADIGRNSYILRWHSLDLSSGSVRDLGSGGDPIYLDPGSVESERASWLADGRTIIFRALVDGAIGLWRADVGGERTEPLVVRDADVQDLVLSGDGQGVDYIVGPSRAEIERAERAEYDSGIFIDNHVDLSQNLFRGGSVNGRMASQRLIGTWFIKDGLLWRSPRQKRHFELATGADHPIGLPIPVPPITLPNAPPPLTSKNEQGEVASAQWLGSSERISATLQGERQSICSDPRCNSLHVSALVWRPQTNDVLLTATDRERRQSLYLWNVKDNRLRLVTAADGLLSGGRRSMFPCAVSEAIALCVAAGPSSPPQLERIDLTSGRRTIVFDPNPEIRAAYKPQVRYLRWTFPGGDAAGVLLQAPGAPRRSPVYLNYYLCEGFLRGGEGDEWPLPALLDSGFAVACINSVPSSGPQDAIADDRTALAAVRALIAKLSSEGIADPAKIAMGGLSHGSEIAFWIASHSNLLACLSISSGQLEPTNYWSGALPGSDQPYFLNKVWGLGSPDRAPATWKKVSPAWRAERIHMPVLLQLPELEARRIPELYARLARAKTPVELYAFPDEAHIKVQPRHRLAVYDRNLDWFRFWLQDFVDPNPSKADQYARWEALKAHWQAIATPAMPQPIAPAQPSR